MNTSAPLTKNRAIRLQQELVPILRATGSIAGAEKYWREVDFAKGFGKKLACYGFNKPERQLQLNKVAFPNCNFVEVDAALKAGNKLSQLYALASGESWIARDGSEQYQRARKGLRIISCKQPHASTSKRSF